MSNEEIIEEILVKSYRLGINELVFELFKKYMHTHDRAQAYQLAYDEAKEELNIIDDE